MSAISSQAKTALKYAIPKNQSGRIRSIRRTNFRPSESRRQRYRQSGRRNPQCQYAQAQCNPLDAQSPARCIGQTRRTKWLFGYRRIHPFRHFPSPAVTAEEIAEVERRVNEVVLANVAVNAAIMSMEDAQIRRHDALRRKIWRRSTRIANGRFLYRIVRRHARFHAPATSASSKSVSEVGIAAGVLRIEAITCLNALQMGARARAFGERHHC